MPRPNKGHQNIQNLKKTPVLFWSVLYCCLWLQLSELCTLYSSLVGFLGTGFLLQRVLQGEREGAVTRRLPEAASQAADGRGPPGIHGLDI